LLKLVSIARAANRRVGDPRHYDRLAMLDDMAVTLVVPCSGDPSAHPIAHDARLNGLDVRFASVRRPAPAGWGDGLHTVRGLRAILQEIQPDVIHVHEEPHTLMAYQAARLRDRVAPQAALVLETEQSATQLPPSALRLSERATHARADVLVVRHRGALEARRFRGFSGLGIVVDHAVDRSLFRPGRRDAARSALGVDGLTIGYFGRLTAEGGLIEVLEAMASCRAPINLVIMGRGDLREELADRAVVLKIADKVRFFEPKDSGDIAFFLSALDILVALMRPAPGARDPFDRTVAEAQACGVPVIVSDEGTLPDMVGEAGWTVDAGDAGMLANLLSSLARNPPAIAAAAAHSLYQAEHRFDIKVVTRELEHAFVIAHQRRVSNRAPVAAGGIASNAASGLTNSAAVPQRVEP
jgi:glycosyltransferase involved in cell wall biosynthesis